MSIAQFARGLQDRVGLEIGGPSELYCSAGLYPIYPHAARVDSCNFSSRTVWDDLSGDRLKEGAYARGDAFVGEATDLRFIADDQYDFVLSSHVLEHCANPLKALNEWRRVVKLGGTMLLVLPHRDGTFDHRRPVTPLRHLLADFERDTPENDLTHLPEILQLHDLEMDPWAGDFETFRRRGQENGATRCLHHHVFDTQLAVTLLDLVKFQVITVEPRRPYHIAVFGRKVPAPAVDNRAFLGAAATYRRTSPFATDRAS